MTTSQRTVLIGAAQLCERDLTLEEAPSPLDMFERIAREAAASTGADPKLLESLDTIAFTETIGWAPSNAPRLLADRLGARPRTEWVSAVGGETSVVLLNDAAQRIADGESELAFVGGANNFRTLGLAQRAGAKIDWPAGGEGSSVTVGSSKRGSNELEASVGLEMPIHIYPLFENGLRAARGQTLEEHRRAMGDLFHPFTKVAAKNPYAWFPIERSAEELVTPTPINRMICFPYPKYLNAVLATDQAAGVLVASEAMARRLGVPEESWIHWRGGSFAAEDPWFVSERPSFAEAPVMKTCHTTALANAGLSLEEIDLFDFYSCFPIAVAMACEMLGLAQDDPRGLTLTGGLPYAGGPGNSYSFHSLAAAVEALRAGRGQHALVTGNGWYMTKQSAAVLSREPAPETAPASTAAATEATTGHWQAAPVELVSEAEGDARVETYTIVHDRTGAPESGIVIGRLTASNQRFLANLPSDAALLESLESEELIGVPGKVRTASGHNEFAPG